MHRPFLLLVTLCVSVMAGCAVAPDNFGITVRSGNRTEVQGINFSAGWNNPFKPRPVRIEEVYVEGGSAQEDMP